MENIIEFKNVSKFYDSDTHALNNVNISIEKGEFVFIVGASGAGKSTFLKLIMHEEAPSDGTIIVNGTDVTKLKRKKVPYLRRNMGIVFQDFRLIEKMSVYDNVAFAMRAIGATPAAVKNRVPYILSLVGLSHKLKSRPSELSGGEQQRVSLARALVNNPAIIIADEPTGNIDPEMSYEIIELLTRINEEGTTILVVTHEHSLVRQFNKRVIEIEKGSVVNDTKADDSQIDDIIFEAEPEEEPEQDEAEDSEEIQEEYTEDEEAAARAFEDDFIEDKASEKSTEEAYEEDNSEENPEDIDLEETPAEESSEDISQEAEEIYEEPEKEETPEEIIEETSDENIPEVIIEEPSSDESIPEEAEPPVVDDFSDELSDDIISTEVSDTAIDEILAEFRELTEKGGDE